VSTTIAGTAAQEIYRNQRAGDLNYHFDLPAGRYFVKLKFAETFFSNPGERVFSVAINDDQVLRGFDIVQQAGAPNTAIDRSFTIDTEGSEGITITSSNSGGDVWYGSLQGIHTVVHQNIGQGTVGVALCAASGEPADSDAILAAADLVGTSWP
jgi:Malectin domain